MPQRPSAHSVLENTRVRQRTTPLLSKTADFCFLSTLIGPDITVAQARTELSLTEELDYTTVSLQSIARGLGQFLTTQPSQASVDMVLFSEFLHSQKDFKDSAGNNEKTLLDLASYSASPMLTAEYRLAMYRTRAITAMHTYGTRLVEQECTSIEEIHATLSDYAHLTRLVQRLEHYPTPRNDTSLKVVG